MRYYAHMRSLFRPAHAYKGMSLVDVLIGTALMLIIFTGLAGILRSALEVSSHAKARSIATALAESQMEFVRSLDYDAAGTVGGIPAGPIPQISTTTQNSIAFTVRTFIQYDDDPADGLAAADTNGITTDYKRIKVSVTYQVGQGIPRTITVASAYAPPGIETTTGGGTLRVAVVNAAGTGVSGASVRIQNSSVTPAIDLTTFTDADGIVFLPGAPTSTQYQINVSKTGYSSAQTYVRDATNQNPTPGLLTVAQNQTTTVTFAIDILASLTVRTMLPIATSTERDTLDSSARITSQTNTQVIGGSLTLAGSVGSYVPAGSATANTVAPSLLARWGIASSTLVAPAGTSVVLRVRDGNGALLPDTVLPGNAAGFTAPVSLASVSTSTYPSLALSAELTTSSASSTPEVLDWSLSYTRGPVPVGAIPFSITGTKAIGTTGAGVTIPKTALSLTTDSAGTQTSSLEWDAYSLSMPSHDVVDACAGPPFELAPGSVQTVTLMVASSTPHALLVTVDSAGGAVAGAQVTLSRSGFSRVVSSSSCGGAYFGNVPTATDYTVTVTAPGFTNFTVGGVTVTGRTFFGATME